MCKTIQNTIESAQENNNNELHGIIERTIEPGWHTTDANMDNPPEEEDTLMVNEEGDTLMIHEVQHTALGYEAQAQHTDDYNTMSANTKTLVDDTDSRYGP